MERKFGISATLANSAAFQAAEIAGHFTLACQTFAAYVVMSIEVKHFAPHGQRIGNQDTLRTFIKKDMLLNGKSNDTGAKHSQIVQWLFKSLIETYGAPDNAEVSEFWQTYLDAETAESATGHILTYIKSFDTNAIGELYAGLSYAVTGNVVDVSNKKELARLQALQEKAEKVALEAENKRLEDKVNRIEAKAQADIALAKKAETLDVPEPSNPNGPPMAPPTSLTPPKDTPLPTPDKADKAPAPATVPATVPTPPPAPMAVDRSAYEVALAAIAALDQAELAMIVKAAQAMMAGAPKAKTAMAQAMATAA